jgi:phosphopantothenoylcysteine decarboxylase/phosphopantothenate--cysteine ligase
VRRARGGHRRLRAGDRRRAANGAKLAAKGLDLIVVNDAREAGAGFEGYQPRHFLSRDGASEPLPLLSKREVADAILDRVERQLGGR